MCLVYVAQKVLRLFCHYDFTLDGVDGQIVACVVLFSLPQLQSVHNRNLPHHQQLWM